MVEQNLDDFHGRLETREQDLMQAIDRQKLPRHIAIIMDGNGRWAQKRGLPRCCGHRAGVESLEEIVDTCCELGIEVLTVYGFSTENWNRPREEIDNLMQLLVEYLNMEIEALCTKGVRVNPIGNLVALPPAARDTLAMAARRSRNNGGLILNLAVNYGGRLEITRAVRAIAFAVEEGRLQAGNIDLQTVADRLYTAGQPDPDLLIRTSGDFRISNFLLWQLAYTEIWITGEFWPDFRRRHLLDALVDYQRRERRFGGIGRP